MLFQILRIVMPEIQIVTLGAGEMVQQFKSTGFSSRAPGFNSQYPRGSSQLSVTPVSGDLMPSSRLCGYQACMWQGKHSYLQNQIKILRERLAGEP